MPGFAVDHHPQKAKIIDLILSGMATRTIGSSVVPPIPHSAVQRYKTSIIKPMVQRAAVSERILTEVPGLKDKPMDFSGLPPAVQAVQKAIQDAPALHIRENRIKAKADRWRRVQMIVDGRAADMSLCANCKKPKDIHPWEDDIHPERRCDTFVAVPGGESGFLARDFKGAGENLQEVYKFDDALFKSFGDIEKDIAIELGQWQENAGSGSVSIQIVCPTQPGEQPKITFAQDETLTLEASAEEVGGMEDIGLLQR